MLSLPSAPYPDRFPSPTEPVSWCRAAEEVEAAVGQSLSVRLYVGLCQRMGETINIRTSIHDGLYTERCSEESGVHDKGVSAVMGCEPTLTSEETAEGGRVLQMKR